MSSWKKLERPRTCSRRGCGWGSVLSTCSRCGKVMLGHNRGLCSRCMDSLGGDRHRVQITKLPPVYTFKAALRAQATEERIANLASAARHTARTEAQK